MKAELTLPPELAKEIAREVIELLKPVLSGNGKQAGNDELFNIQDVCNYFKVSKQWVYERTHLNEIPFYKIDGHLRFKKIELNKWLQKYHVSAVPK
jgi:excisionase family DNA binding protein